jgi:hypothetical protein
MADRQPRELYAAPAIDVTDATQEDRTNALLR